jgi:hypothetical protein
MTALLKYFKSDSGAIEPSESEFRVAVRRALDTAGCATFDQLQQQALTGQFASTKARMAWVAIEELREYS